MLTVQRETTPAPEPAKAASPNYALWALVAVLFAGVIGWLSQQGG